MPGGLAHVGHPVVVVKILRDVLSPTADGQQ